MTGALVVLSGGMDSTTALWDAAVTNDRVDAVSFDYGQRHAVELDAARQLDIRFRTDNVGTGGRHDVVDLRAVGSLLDGSALTDDTVDVPHGHYADDMMRATVVPGRNTMFTSVAAAIAEARGLDYVILGVHAGDHPVYPDCRPSWAVAMDHTIGWSTEGRIALRTPFLNMTKAQIVAHGDKLGVPYEHTWSCYEGADVHCGACGTCVERREAFQLAGVDDPTDYRS